MADYEYTEDQAQPNFETPTGSNSEETENPASTTETAETNGDSERVGQQGDKINASKNEDDDRKIFVGGLSWETTAKDLRDYFSKFGDVIDCTLKTDMTTGRSRGFGFVLFGSAKHLDKVFAAEAHLLHGRNIDPKPANPRGNKEALKKIFVGGLDPETPEDEIRKHFGQYGKIEEVDLPYDKMKGQRRAFCFITFESEEMVDKCCGKAKQTIGAKEVDVKKATPKDPPGGFGFGGRGRAWNASPARGRGGRSGRGYNQGWNEYEYYNPNFGYSGYDYNQGNYGYDYYNQGWGNYNQGYGSGYGGNNSYGNNYGGKKRYMQRRNGNNWANHV